MNIFLLMFNFNCLVRFTITMPVPGSFEERARLLNKWKEEVKNFLLASKEGVQVCNILGSFINVL